MRSKVIITALKTSFRSFFLDPSTLTSVRILRDTKQAAELSGGGDAQDTGTRLGYIIVKSLTHSGVF